MAILAQFNSSIDQASFPGLPQTPVGKRFAEWLNIFNRGDEAELQEFAKNYAPSLGTELTQIFLEVRKQSEGFDIRLVEEPSHPTQLTVWVQERGGLEMYPCIKFEVDPEKPQVITNIELHPPEPIIKQKVERVSEHEAIEATRSFIEDLAKQNRFSGAVIISKNGQPLLAQAVGYANKEDRIKNNLQTKFNIASQGKMFTTVAILQLVEKKKIDLEAPIGEYLKPPEFNIGSSGGLTGDLAKVTVKQLLTHTGGTGTDQGPEFHNAVELKEYVNLGGERKLEFTPGEHWEYSNFGFILLGAIIEQASGQNYYDYIQENIYDKVGMSNSGAYFRTEEVENKATGYIKKGGYFQKNDEFLSLRGHSAGGSYSTAEDMQKFANALLENKLLQNETMNAATTPQIVTASGANYCYGFMSGADFDQETHAESAKWFGHEGHSEGANTDLRVYPRTGYVIAVMSNQTSGACDIAEFIGARLPS